MKYRLLLLALLLLLLCGCQKPAQPCDHHELAAEIGCEEDRRCIHCGTLIGKAPGHQEKLTDCEQGSFCAVCGEQLSKPSAHVPGPAATCGHPQICAVCGKELAPAPAHEPVCDDPCHADTVCAICGEVLRPAAHEPEGEADCLSGTLCAVCGEIIAEPLGHEPGPEATETEPQVCLRCGAVLKAAGNGSGGPAVETAEGVHYHNYLDAYLSAYVTVCGDYALEYFSMDETGCSGWARALNALAERHPELNVSGLLVPKCCAFHAPAGSAMMADNQKAFIDSTYAMLDEAVVAVDAFSVISAHSEEYLYYRTDHHWTSLGAYYASYAYCRANGITPRFLGDYETTMQEGMIGSLYDYCASPQECLKENPDYTVCHLPACEYKMEIDNGSGFFEAPLLNTENRGYASVFIAGDNALTRITTDNHTGRSLLIFKESYGNAFVPYMADYYDTILVVDIRQSTPSTDTLIADYGITDVLVINNVQGAQSLWDTLEIKLS